MASFYVHGVVKSTFSNPSPAHAIDFFTQDFRPWRQLDFGIFAGRGGRLEFSLIGPLHKSVLAAHAFLAGFGRQEAIRAI